ncbi:MAG: permease [Deltaproteobacteria bacterium]|nr:permease [Deltaproteobacteria bacterium]
MIESLVIAGLLAIKDYVATHVLTCLVPAFLLAGAMVAFINQQAILSVLGEKANKFKSFSLASFASFFVAACSCTVIPVSSGLYFSGAAVGVAFIILWVSPSANILSLIYTGNILGYEMVFYRVIAALLMAFIVGGIMTFFFGKEVRETFKAYQGGEEPQGIVKRPHLILMILILLSLLLPNYIGQTGPYWEKVLIWGTATAVLAVYAFKFLGREEIASWLRESWWFIKLIFPLLLLGVFLVGVLGKLLPEEWIRSWLGGNGLMASFLATMIGSISYFATMTEAPFVDTLMKLGMGKGPALTLLLTGPGLSLPNWIAIGRVFGIKKAVVYVISIIILGTLVGWFFGNFIM